MIDTLIYLITLCGYLKLLDISIRLIEFVFRYLRYGKLAHLPQKYGKGSYAVVTGGTNDIGREFSNKLAELGFNLIIISNDKE